MAVPLLNMSETFVTSWAVTHQAALSMGFSRKKHIALGYHLLLQGILPIEPSSLSEGHVRRGVSRTDRSGGFAPRLMCPCVCPEVHS